MTTIPYSRAPAFFGRKHQKGGDSAAPDYPLTCARKAKVLNEFCREQNVESVIKFGCGEGVQSALFAFKIYTGFDISEKAIALCRKNLWNDASKEFRLLRSYVDQPLT